VYASSKAGMARPFWCIQSCPRQKWTRNLPHLPPQARLNQANFRPKVHPKSRLSHTNRRKYPHYALPRLFFSHNGCPYQRYRQFSVLHLLRRLSWPTPEKSRQTVRILLAWNQFSPPQSGHLHTIKSHSRQIKRIARLIHCLMKNLESRSMRSNFINL
jgi:hypothetical protein